jgi:hypothetical protein
VVASPARLPAQLIPAQDQVLMARALYLSLAFFAAAPLTAICLVGFARYDMGMSRAAIRVDALSAADVIFAAVAAVSLLGRKK